jgi:ABC-type uncharacterized transport system substrate-binding protein
MQRIFVFLFLLWLEMAHAATIVVVNASNSPFGRKYFSGFSSLATERISAFNYDPGKDQALIAQVKRVAPDLIFSIGPVPIRKIADALPSTPLIASRQFDDLSLKRANVVWMEKERSLAHALSMLQALQPNRKTIGTVYNPNLSKDSLDDLVTEGGKLGYRVASLKVDSAADVKTLIGALAGKVDTFYYLADQTTLAAAADIRDFVIKNALPMVSPDPGDVENGALLSVSSDPFKMGEAAWETAKLILDQKKIPKAAALANVQKGELISISLSAAGKLSIPPDALHAFFQKVLSEKYSVQLLP